MKKKLFILGLIFILLISCLVIGIDDTEGDGADVSIVNVDETNTPLAGAVGELGEAGKGIINSDELEKKSDEILTREIEIPEKFQIAAKIVFGLKAEEKVDLQTFVILIGLWIILLIIIVSLLGIVYAGAEKWLLGVVATLLIAITGVMKKLAIFLIGFGNLFGFLEKAGWLKFILILGLMAVLFYIFSRVLKLIKNKTDIEKAVQTGYDIALERATAKATREVMK